MGAESPSTIRFSDGTELPIDWVYPEAPDSEWEFEREHWPDPLTPMELWIWQNGQTGADRAWEEAGLEPPPMFRRFQTAGPFLYTNATMPPPERIAVMAPRYIAVAQKYGGAQAFWQSFCEPRIRRSCDEIAAMNASAGVRGAAELLFYGFHQTFTCLGLLFLPNMRLSALLADAGITDTDLTGVELTQGGDNATQAIDEEIWRLAELARAAPIAAGIIAADAGNALDELRRAPEAAPFLAGFDALIERHGRRSLGWMLTLPTWRERPEAALALVRAQILSERTTPDELRASSARRREQATERALAALPAAKHDEFRSIIGELDGFVPVREGRAYWQLVIVGEMRALLLRIGAELVRGRLIGSADDVLFLTPGEMGDSPSIDLRERVARSRAAWERWRGITPPKTIGTPGAAASDGEVSDAEFRGTPASRGTVTAPVRILRSPEEGDKLHRGDILVCVMTTPAWTPLFAIAGGIITETGGALSHPAITAREYGIPAVVALPDATKRLQDGETVTLDGSAGTVTHA